MTDESSRGGQGQPGGGGNLEMTPHWGGAGGDAKPKPVAVRKKGDVAEAMVPSAADQEYRQEIAVASKQVAKERRVGFVLLVVSLLVVGGFTAWKAMRVEVSVSGTADTSYKIRKATVTAKVVSSHDVEVGIEGHGDRKPAKPGTTELTFDIDLDKLPLGANDLQVQVLKGGAVVEAASVTTFHDFDLETDLAKVSEAPHNVYLNFTLPAEWKVRVNKQDYEPGEGGKVAVPVPLADVFAALDRFEDSQYPMDIPIKVVRKGGEEFMHMHKVQVTLPSARLDLGDWGDAMVATGKNLEVQGRSDPGAVVKIDGEDVPVAPDGSFTTTIKLPKAKGFKLDAKDLAAAVASIRAAAEAGLGKAIRIVVKLPGKVTSHREIVAVAGDKKGKAAKQFAKLAAAK